MTFFIYHSKLKRIYFSFFDLRPNIESYLYFEINPIEKQKIFFCKNGILFFSLDRNLKLKIKRILNVMITCFIIYIYFDTFSFLFKLILQYFVV